MLCYLNDKVTDSLLRLARCVFRCSVQTALLGWEENKYAIKSPKQTANIRFGDFVIYLFLAIFRYSMGSIPVLFLKSSAKRLEVV